MAMSRLGEAVLLIVVFLVVFAAVTKFNTGSYDHSGSGALLKDQPSDRWSLDLEKVSRKLTAPPAPFDIDTPTDRSARTRRSRADDGSNLRDSTAAPLLEAATEAQSTAVPSTNAPTAEAETMAPAVIPARPRRTRPPVAQPVPRSERRQRQVRAPHDPWVGVSQWPAHVPVVYGPLYDPAWWSPGKCAIPYDDVLLQYCADVETEEQFKAKPMCTVSKNCSFRQGGTYVKPLSVRQLDAVYKSVRDRMKETAGSESCTDDKLSSRSDAQIQPLTFAAAAPFELQEIQGCPIHNMSPLEAIGVLRKAARGGPIIFSGDSLLRQYFHRLVTFLRGSKVSADAVHFHTDIVYTIGTKGDDYSVMADAVVEVFPESFRQILGDEYAGGFDYNAHLTNVGADVGEPLLVIHFLWNTYMHEPRTAPIVALKPKTVITAWNLWFPPGNQEPLKKQLADSLAWWEKWLKEDKERTVLWPLGQKRVGAHWESFNPWVGARNQIVPAWRKALPDDIKTRFLLVDNEAQQHFGGPKFQLYDDVHYGSCFHTVCTVNLGHNKKYPNWCSSAEFAAGGKVVARWFSWLMRDQFNLNLGQWAMNHMVWRLERDQS